MGLFDEHNNEYGLEKYLIESGFTIRKTRFELDFIAILEKDDNLTFEFRLYKPDYSGDKLMDFVMYIKFPAFDISFDFDDGTRYERGTDYIKTICHTRDTSEMFGVLEEFNNGGVEELIREK